MTTELLPCMNCGGKMAVWPDKVVCDMFLKCEACEMTVYFPTPAATESLTRLYNAVAAKIVKRADKDWWTHIARRTTEAAAELESEGYSKAAEIMNELYEQMECAAMDAEAAEYRAEEDNERLRAAQEEIAELRRELAKAGKGKP